MSRTPVFLFFFLKSCVSSGLPPTSLNNFRSIMLIHSETYTLISFPPSITRHNMFRYLNRSLRHPIRQPRFQACTRRSLRAFPFHRLIIQRTNHTCVIRSFRTIRCRLPMGLITPHKRNSNRYAHQVSTRLFNRITRIIYGLQCFVMGAMGLDHVTSGQTRQIRMVIRLPLRIHHTFRFFLHPRVPYDLRRRSLLLIFRFLLNLINVGRGRSHGNHVILHLCLQSANTRRRGPCQSCPLRHSSFFVVLFSANSNYHPTPTKRNRANRLTITTICRAHHCIIPRIIRNVVTRTRVRRVRFPTRYHRLIIRDPRNFTPFHPHRRIFHTTFNRNIIRRHRRKGRLHHHLSVRIIRIRTNSSTLQIIPSNFTRFSRHRRGPRTIIVRINANFRQQDVAIHHLRMAIMLLFPLVCTIRLHYSAILRRNNLYLPFSLFICLTICRFISLNRNYPFRQIQDNGLHLNRLQGRANGRGSRPCTGSSWSREFPFFIC